MHSAINIKNLNVKINKKNILKNITLNIRKNRIVSILGPNGAGKSTFFLALLGIIGDYSDHIRFNTKQSDKAKILAYVPQNITMSFSYKVIDVVLFGANPSISIFAHPNQSHISQAKKHLETFGILDLADRKIDELSGGQRQLVLLARALMQDSEILLLDEPTSALDIKNQNILLKHISKLRHKTILINIHDPNLALEFSDEIIMIKNGEILLHKDTDEITDRDFSLLYDMKVDMLKIDGLKIIKIDTNI